MSLLKNVVNTVSYDPRTQIATQKEYNIPLGCKSITYNQQSSQNTSDQQLTWDISPPSTEILIDRQIMIELPSVTFTFAGSDLGQPLLNMSDGTLGPRALPIASIITSSQLKIGNVGFTDSLSLTVPALLRYDHEDRNDQIWSGSGAYPDQSQSYDDLVGGTRNPLCSYESSVGYGNPRGLLNSTWTVSSNTNTAATLVCSFTEPLMISLLSQGLKDSSPLVGVNKIQLALQLGSLTRLLSIAENSAHTYSSVSATFGATPAKLLINYLTRKSAEPIPPVVHWGYSQLQDYTTTIGSVTSGSSFSTTTTNMQLGTIPERIYIFCKRRTTDETCYTTDSFARISNVSINFDNRNGLLNTATEYQLWQICKENGLCDNWSQFHSWVGGVLCFNPVKDWGLDEGQAPGIVGKQYNLQITVAGTNISAETINYNLYVVTQCSGVMTLENGNFSTLVGNITESDVLSAPSLPRGKFSKDSLYGEGNIWNKIKEFAGKAHGFIKDNKLISKGLSKIANPYAQGAAQFADQMGYGLEGGAYSGGNLLSKAQMKSMRGRY